MNRAWTSLAALISQLTLASLLVGALTVLGSVRSEAMMCRDCPFPIRTANDKWLMPNGKVEVEIHEEAKDRDTNILSVWLREPKTGEVLASGRMLRPVKQLNFIIRLTDRGGTFVKGEIRYVRPPSEIIQARFTCVDRCSIADKLQ